MILDKLQTFPALRQVINAWLTAGVMDGDTYSTSETGIAQGGVLSPLLMNVALHGMEAVVTEGSTNGHTREQPLLVRYADDFVILHADLKELQQAVRRVKHWLARMGLHLHADKTRITHTLTPYQGQVSFDFLGFNIRQEPVELPPVDKHAQESSLGSKTSERTTRAGARATRAGASETIRAGASETTRAGARATRAGASPTSATRAGASPARTLYGLGGSIRSRVGAGLAPALVNTLGVKTIIVPSQEANKRHLAAIEQRLLQLQTAPQARVIEELNPLIVGWTAYYNGIVPAASMSRYDDLLEQRLVKWASKRHPGKERDWLLARYWQRVGKQRKVFGTHDGVQLRAYRQTSILRGEQ